MSHPEDDKVIPGIRSGNLATVLESIVDHFAGPERIRKRAEANASATVIAAEAELEIEELHERATARRQKTEIRRQRNIEAISQQAMLQLPSPDSKVTIPIAEDFVHRFFADCADIGDPEQQILWGKLLSDEVNRPGSFHPSTLRILKDLTKADINKFAALCRFVVTLSTGDRFPIINLHGNPMVKAAGLTFDDLSHLVALGIIHRSEMGEYVQNDLPQVTTATYIDRIIEIAFVGERGNITLGEAIFTLAGMQLSKLAVVEPVDGLFEEIVQKWSGDGASVVELKILDQR